VTQTQQLTGVDNEDVNCLVAADCDEREMRMPRQTADHRNFGCEHRLSKSQHNHNLFCLSILRKKY